MMINYEPSPVRRMAVSCPASSLTLFSLPPPLLPYLSGAVPCASSSANYTGRQFSSPPAALGDGRAHLLPSPPAPLPLSLKGSGPTPFTRPGADGRGAWSSLCREHFLSLHLAESQVPAVAPAGLLHSSCPSDRVARDERHKDEYRLYAGGVLARKPPAGNPGLYRFGSPALEAVLPPLFPGCAADPACLLSAVAEASARSFARLQAAGLVHGALNSDNLLLTGEVLDLNVMAPLGRLELGYTPNRIDEEGQYASGALYQVAWADLQRRCLRAPGEAGEGCLREVARQAGGRREQDHLLAGFARMLEREARLPAGPPVPALVWPGAAVEEFCGAPTPGAEEFQRLAELVEGGGALPGGGYAARGGGVQSCGLQ
ncbi:hypothetical protein TeGR_g11159 [Tetraparma gracilis]|uniref:Selenoprotein O n=1 Tax=Tetraparma gracilis TaxID=2962635 RepID=A0ABQ6ME74_9STRA|nr:hypothetical protein TeGR_g11159 [Tetraparma gracilis]